MQFEHSQKAKSMIQRVKAFMDLEMRTMAGAPVEFLQAAVHAVLFYVSWLFPPILFVSLFNNDKRCLHDMLADVIVLRRAV